MSEAISQPELQAEQPPAEFQRPGSEEFFEGAVPDPHDVAIEDINPMSGRLFSEDKHWGFFERLRNESPVHFNETELAGRYWSLSRYEDIKKVDSDHERFSSAHGITLGFPVDTPLPEGALNVSMFIAMDPPTHDVQRRTVSPIVAPSNLANLEALIRQRTRTILDDLPIGESFNWVDRVSIELTTQMLATLFDFPFEERRKLTRWSDIATAPIKYGIVDSEEQRRAELFECLAYFTQLREERLNRDEANDLLTMMARGKATQDMAPQEILGNLLLLIVGGSDTTRDSMSGGVVAMNRFPEQLKALRSNPEKIPAAVSEIIRWQTPLAFMRRTAKEDVELNGQRIRAGDKVVMWYVSGNRDDTVFENPDALDIERANVRNHLSFGFGIHRCMGNRLAELQLRILWEELLPRFKSIEVVGEPVRTLSNFVRGYVELPVTLTRH